MIDYELISIDNAAEPTFGVQLPGPHVIAVHPRSKCEGQTCCIHNPSEHHMLTWPMNWRGDTGVMERICAHGVGHPDPDATAYQKSLGNTHHGTHGCDGCCQKRES